MKMDIKKYGLVMLIGFMFLAGCNGTTRSRNLGHVSTYPVLSSEAEWIRNGEPIEFEGALWYPQDGVETLLDSEVYILGEYRGVQYFVDRVDVRPYERLYTKFSRNKFRYFERLRKKK